MQNSKGYTMVVLDLRFGQVLMKIFSFKVEVSFIVSATVQNTNGKCYNLNRKGKSRIFDKSLHKSIR